MKIICEATLDRFRAAGRCAWCGQWFPRLEPHHLTACGTGGHKRLDIPINLLPLGPTYLLHPCHTFLQRADAELQMRQLEIVAKREQTTTHDIEAVRWAILRIPKEGRPAQVEREAATLTAEQQVLFWSQLGYAARPIGAADPDPMIEEPPF